MWVYLWARRLVRFIVPAGDTLLTDQAIRTAKPREKPYRIADGKGLTLLVNPSGSNRAINEIKAPDVLRLLKRIEERGLHETAHRARQRCSQIFRYGVITERCEHDVTADLRGALAAVTPTHHASITEPEKMGQLLRDIEGYRGNAVTWYALRLAAHVFVRPGELRHAEWSEFDLQAKEPCWRIPAHRMKMGEPHVVPLSKQVTAWLKELHELTGNGDLVFPSLHSTRRPISGNTVNMALRRMGYDNETMTGHGFRSMASTSLTARERFSALRCSLGSMPASRRSLAFSLRSRARARDTRGYTPSDNDFSRPSTETSTATNAIRAA